MWILDSAYRDGGIDLWTKDGTVTKVHHDYNPPFSSISTTRILTTR